MKKLFIVLLSLISLAGFAQVVNVGTLPNDGTGDSWRNAMIKINNEFARIASVDTTITHIVTSTQVNAGDTVIILPTSSIQTLISGITILKSSGVDYTAVSTDTTATIYVNCGGVKNAVGYIYGRWFVGSMLSGQLSLTGCMDVGSPIWVDFPPDLATGTRTITFKIYKR
jgi:hypothetical protein